MIVSHPCVRFLENGNGGLKKERVFEAREYGGGLGMSVVERS